jgi:hypothetical protein
VPSVAIDTDTARNSAEEERKHFLPFGGLVLSLGKTIGKLIVDGAKGIKFKIKREWTERTNSV